MRPARWMLYLWVMPTTALGLLFVAPAIFGGEIGIIEGVIEIHGGIAAWFLRRCTLLQGGASAMTLGHVVLGRDQNTLDRTRAHERVHVRQCEIWGPLFLPAYLVGSIVALLR